MENGVRKLEFKIVMAITPPKCIENALKTYNKIVEVLIL